MSDLFFENIVNENTTSNRQLIIHEIMGRHCGWLTAATAYEYRKRLGAELAKESNIEADLIIPVPDSGVPAAIPVVGNFMVELLRGGESVGQSTLTRFYSLHTFVMPWLLAVFMLMHFLMIRKQGISGPL